MDECAEVQKIKDMELAEMSELAKDRGRLPAGAGILRSALRDSKSLKFQSLRKIGREAEGKAQL